jgi:hypothetical protein
MCIGPEELPTSVTEGRESGDDVADVQQRDAFTWTVAMLSRIDFAAAYLALVTGARPPIDSPDGLGRPGRAAQHLPPTGPVAEWSEGESGSWS